MKDCELKSQQVSAENRTEKENGWPRHPYGVSKAGMNAFTAVLGREHPGLLINACCPGWVATDMGRYVGQSPPKTTGKQTPFHEPPLAQK